MRWGVPVTGQPMREGANTNVHNLFHAPHAIVCTRCTVLRFQFNPK
jgi:hypothetical protein